MSPDPKITSHLARFRQEAGLSQSELARRVGVSRQGLAAIEGGRQVPSTALSLRLGRALGRSVEDLFALPAERPLEAVLETMSEGTTESRSVPIGQRVLLGRVSDSWAAHPVPHDRATAADGRVVGPGKRQGTVHVEPLLPLSELSDSVLVAGCAPLMGLLAAHSTRSMPQQPSSWLPANSSQALRALQQGTVHVAGVHLSGPRQDATHEDLVRRHFPDDRMLVVHLTKWRQGIVVAAGNPLGIQSVADLVREDVRLATRESGSGARKLLDELLVSAGVAAGIDGPQAHDHASIARLVGWGVADAGIAIESSALGRGLDFVPLVEERFDLVLSEAMASRPEVARLVDQLKQRAFRTEASGLPGYDLSDVGDITTVATG